MLDDLEQVRRDIDRRLAQAVTSRHAPMHSPVIATADADTRILVLRAFDPASATLRFHTDARSPKAALIGAGAPLGALFYDREEKVQIRCRGTGRIEHTGPVADAAWAASTRFARRCYLGDGPGTVSDQPTSGLPQAFEGHEPDEDELLMARENFAVLLMEVTTFDWFHLAHTGHRRAVFDGAGARWITP